jgi:uncharacterized protein YndB with AHSA1/START domain
MKYEDAITIAAPRERIWSILTDVERWPEWTASMSSVRFVAGDRIAVGSRASIKQPRMPAVVWEVTAVEPEKSFTWQARSAGMTTTATHSMAPGSGGAVTVKLGIRQQGALGWLVGLLLARMTRRYVRMEAAGLKRRCEAA